MKNKTIPYKTISCSFYDLLLEKATLKEVAQLVYMDNGESETSCSGVIIDVYTKNKEEFLKLDSELIIRLDYVISVGDKNIADFINCTY